MESTIKVPATTKARVSRLEQQVQQLMQKQQASFAYIKTKKSETVADTKKDAIKYALVLG